MCLMILLVYLLLLLLLLTQYTQAHGQCTCYTRTRENNGRWTDEGMGTVIACIETAQSIHLARLHPHLHTATSLAAGLPWLLMIRAFSARHPAMAFIPDVRLICHWLLSTSFCPSAVQPLEMHGRSDAQNHQRVLAGLPAANDAPLDDSSYCSPQSPGRAVGFRCRRNRAML